MHNPEADRDCHTGPWAGALLLLAVLLVWPWSLGGPFQFDDWNVIVEQPAVHSLASWWASMPGIRPLLKLCYALNWQLWPGAASFHALNVLLHAANVWLVWRLLAAWPQLDSRAAWWVALIFALHPAQTEAITYISGRSMALMALFWLSAAGCWLGRRRGLAVSCFLAAMAVRETAWSLPFVLLVWQRAQGTGWRAAARALWPLWLALAGAALLVLGQPAYQRMLADALASRGPLANLALQVEALRYLLVEPLLLLRNNIDPELPAAARFDVAWWLGFGAILGAAALGVRWLSRRPAPGLALLWPLLLLLPTNGLIARSDPAAERHLYLALLGPAILLVSGIGWLGGRRANLVLLGLAVLLGAATLLRIRDYRSESALWEATRLASPNKPRVWNNLGYAYLTEGRPADAIPALRRALELSPGFLRAELNLERAQAALARSGDAAVAAPLENQ